MKRFILFVLVLVISLVSVSEMKAASINHIVYDKNNLNNLVENRAMEVGSELDYLQVNVTGTIQSVSWTNEDSSVVSISGSNLNPLIKAKKVGTTRLKVTITTLEGDSGSQYVLLSIYSKLNNEFAYTRTNDAIVKKGALPSSPERGVLPLNQSFNILGQCGSYYYINMVDDINGNYDFNDSVASDYGFILKSKVSIPTTSYTLNKDSISLKLKTNGSISYSF
ncbi:MAG: hypothetical protein LBT75_02485, partial [Bacilli bacterium]|nr:hypothetical protein [Bacilli bacterium]